MSFQCTFCSKKYVRKHAFDRHYLLCKNIHYTRTRKDIDYDPTDCMTDSDFEKEIDLPSPVQIYKLILTVLKRQERIIQDIDRLKKGQHLHFQKLDVVQWLEHNRNPYIAFTHWVENKLLQVDKKEILNTIFEENNIQKGFVCILHDLFKNMDMTNCPIQSFSHKQDIYVYNTLSNDTTSLPEWIIWSNEHIQQYIQLLHNFIIRCFLDWSQQQQSRINQDMHFYECIYVSRQNLIVNAKIATSFMKEKVYDTIVQNSKTITAYKME